jgi:hypothetical protein
VDVVGHAIEVMRTAKELFTQGRVENVFLNFEPVFWNDQQAIELFKWFENPLSSLSKFLFYNFYNHIIKMFQGSLTTVFKSNFLLHSP